MMTTRLAIVGRPNVGKSTLFNRLCRRRYAIVDPAAGVTRDRLHARTDFFGRSLELIDTAGWERCEGSLQRQLRQQTEQAIAAADGLLLVVDAHVGLTADDAMLARQLLRQRKPLAVAINKVDAPQQIDHANPFAALGIAAMVHISALHGNQTTELLEALLPQLTATTSAAARSPAPVLTVVGRPNVGKSTFINCLLQQQRCLVDAVAGTTRDAIAIDTHIAGQPCCLIDTAGLWRRRRQQETVSKFAALRTQQAIAGADVCLLLLDARQGIQQQEKRLFRQISQQAAGCVLLLNKWDLVQGRRMESCWHSLQQEVAFARHCPLLFLSARTGRNVDQAMQVALQVAKERHKRISTGQLNRFLQRCLARNPPPRSGGRRLRIYYLTQVTVAPPHFVLFTNRAGLLLESYRHYLLNALRREFGYRGVTLLLSLRRKCGEVTS